MGYFPQNKFILMLTLQAFSSAFIGYTREADWLSNYITGQPFLYCRVPV